MIGKTCPTSWYTCFRCMCIDCIDIVLFAVCVQLAMYQCSKPSNKLRTLEYIPIPGDIDISATSARAWHEKHPGCLRDSEGFFQYKTWHVLFQSFHGFLECFIPRYISDTSGFALVFRLSCPDWTEKSIEKQRIRENAQLHEAIHFGISYPISSIYIYSIYRISTAVK